MRKLKYHQYIPPDQRGGSGTGGTNIMLYFSTFIQQLSSLVQSRLALVCETSEFIIKIIISRGRSQTEEPYPYPVFRPSLFPSPEAAAGLPPAANPPEPAAAATTAAATATITTAAHCCAQVCKEIAADTASGNPNWDNIRCFIDDTLVNASVIPPVEITMILWSPLEPCPWIPNLFPPQQTTPLWTQILHPSLTFSLQIL